MGNKVQKQENLVLAIQLGNESKICSMIDKFYQADPDFVNTPINKLGDTVLHYAAYKKMSQVIQKALNLGANASIKNGRGQLPVDVIDNEDSSAQANSIRAMLLTNSKGFMKKEEQEKDSDDDFMVDDNEEIPDYMRGTQGEKVIVQPDQ